MVNRLRARDHRLDRIFGALANASRRRILEQLADGEFGVTELDEGTRMSQPALTKHLAVLERAGLITRRRAGRFRYSRPRPGALDPTRDWIARVTGLWEARLDELERMLAEGGESK